MRFWGALLWSGRKSAELAIARTAVRVVVGCVWACYTPRQYARMRARMYKQATTTLPPSHPPTSSSYQDASGELKPGRKGISLQPDQFSQLASGAARLGEALRGKDTACEVELSAK